MNRLNDIFTFSEAFPLIFTQAGFWIFFAIVYFFFALVYKKIPLRNTYLFLVSLFFYYKTSGLFVGVLIASIVANFFIGNAIYKNRSKNQKKFWVTIGVIINLFVLSYFKYAYFFTDSFNQLFNTQYETFNWLAQWGNNITSKNYFTVDKIVLPVGISFYLFQIISYIVDIYQDRIKPLRSILDFGFYVSFFPQLVAGPIVRADYFIPQISRPTQISKVDFNAATYMILRGLIKKMIFADYIAAHFLDRVFDAPEMYSGFANLMALIGYSLQIYGDFSGYTDIAIGLALLMGFQLPQNFNSPYKAKNAGEFWKRWHISLSTWLRDYLYIPLGGNRKGSKASYVILSILLIGTILAFNFNKTVIIITSVVVLLLILLGKRSPNFKNHINTNINMMLTMLIGGLWHGASWKFVIWGGLNGLGMLVYKYWRKISPYENKNTWVANFWKITITFLFITFTRIFFRGNDMESISKWYQQVFYQFDLQSAWDIMMHYKIVFIIMLIGFISHWLPETIKSKIEQGYNNSPIIAKIIIAFFVGIACYQVFSSDMQAFIYFQF